MSQTETRCAWCGKDRKTFSDWEQEGLDGQWKRLCKPCARIRLDNPYSAILSMRKLAGLSDTRRRET